MRRYESVVILDPEMPDDDIRNFTEKYSELIKTNGGEIIKIEDWGFKRLAYLVKKKEKGRYILFDFVGLPAVITELERQFKISEEVLKFLSVKLDDDVDLEAFKAAEEEKQAAAAARRAPAAPAAVEPAAPAVTEEGAEPAAEEAIPPPETVEAPAEPAEQEAPSTPETEVAPASAEAQTAEPAASEEKKEGE
ncbi:MAG: 30S ribosomal protein S6 [Desulfomonilaceae bacterium]